MWDGYNRGVMMKLQSHKPSPISHETISHQLELMLANPEFTATPQQIAFLNYVVDQTLTGKADRIKGYTVATEVLGRGADFDQSIDPVVSIQAGRLRRALERYYLTAGEHDPIRIDIPKGTYVPTFREQHPSDRHIATEQVEPLYVMATWPTVLVRPLVNLSGNPDDDYLSTGLTVELAHSLSHYREIQVLEPHHRDPETTPSKTDFDFIIAGNVRRDPERITVAIRLNDAKKGFQIWSGKYRVDLEMAKMIAFQEEVAAKVAARVAGGYGEIPRYLSGLNINKATPKLSTYEAMLRFSECDTLLTPQLMVRAIDILERAVTHEPDCGQLWSMLAGLYANNHGLEIVDLPTPLEKAAEFAQRGVRLDPTNRRARMIFAYVCFMQNRLQEARYEAEATYHLHPDSLMVLDRIGWLMAMTGEWDRGINWVAKAIKLTPYYRPWVRHALCFNWFRLGNYEKAYQETLSFTMPEFFWDQLMKASTCGHLGRIKEGRACVRALLALKPNFVQRGRILIGRYIKFDDIAERIIEGVGKLGMKIEA